MSNRFSSSFTEFFASFSRLRPSATRPSISLCAGGSAFNWPIFARFSRLLELAIGTDHEYLRLLQHPHDEAVALAALAAQFGRLVDRRIYLASNLFLRGLQRLDDVLVADVCRNDENIH